MTDVKAGLAGGGRVRRQCRLAAPRRVTPCGLCAACPDDELHEVTRDLSAHVEWPCSWRGREPADGSRAEIGERRVVRRVPGLEVELVPRASVAAEDVLGDGDCLVAVVGNAHGNARLVKVLAPTKVADAVVFDSVTPLDAQKNSPSFPPDVGGAVTVTVPLKYEYVYAAPSGVTSK